jgi:hypothetical protein
MRPLHVVAAVLAVLVAAFYGWRLLWSRWGDSSPETLAGRALTAESAVERQQAAVDLASAGQPALAHLRRVLGESDDPDVRAACVQGLGDLRDYESAEVLIDLLGDRQLLVRARAEKAISRLLRRDVRFPVEGSAAARTNAQNAVRETYQQLCAAGLLEHLKAGKSLAYYFDRNSKQLFEAPEESEALIEAPSGAFRGRPAGARANVFSCGDCGDPAQQFVGYLLVPAEDARKRGENIVGSPPPSDDELMVICRPDEDRWFYFGTREGDAITAEASRRCRNHAAVLCRPGW